MITSSVRRLPVAAVFFLACALLVPSAGAQGRRGRGGDDAQRPPQPPPAWKGKADVSGKVLDESGKGIDQAKVTLVNKEVKAGFFAMTKKNGEFSAKDIKAGAWKLIVEAPKYVTAQQDIEITDQKNAPLEVKLAVDRTPELIAKGEELYKAGKFADARVEYQKVLEAHPEAGGEVNRAIAFTYGREKNHAEALKYLDLALQAKPDDMMLLQLAAASAIEVSDYPRAMGYMAKVEDASLTSDEVLVNAGVNMLTRRQADHAMILFARAIARFPESPDAYFYRGLIELQTQKTAEAKADLEKFVALAPANAPQLAQAKELLGKIK
jgi:tetratricopeptide (TPR) repeat protein